MTKTERERLARTLTAISETYLVVDLDCPRCQGVGLIDQGYIIDGQVTNLTREQCPCITRTVDSY